nr:MAG TPA: hypothetical protein [Caudoviricetes sp.]
MLNVEKYKGRILELEDADYLFSVNKCNNKIKACCVSECTECLFNTGNCSRARTRWLLSEYKEPIKLTRLEYEILKYVQKEGFNFITRTYHISLYGNLFIYETKPIKYDSSVGWCTTSKSYVLYAFNDLFQFVKWEDEEPTLIKDVLDNCEVVEDA